jgi:hypothetical protein
MELDGDEFRRTIATATQLSAEVAQEREAVKTAKAVSAAFRDPEFGYTDETRKVLSCVAGHYRRLIADNPDAVERFNETLSLKS